VSLLFPLYLGGLLALSLPVIFHLIRRTPSGRIPFSSLMFLKKSPPRLVKRKSLDQLWLLLLRAAILALLALAFARPYLRTESRVEAAGGPGPRIAVLLDTSASMQRSGVWSAALAEVEKVLADAASDEVVSLSTFDGEHTVEVSFEQAQRLGSRGALDLVRERLRAIQPTWGGTDLAGALVDVADSMQGLETPPGQESTIVLISDLQQAGGIADLETYEWPAALELDIRRVASSGQNAGLHPVPRTRGETDADLHVRITNAEDSVEGSFQLQWASKDSQPAGESLQVSCPPGQTRVVRAPPRPLGMPVDRLVLSGDGAPFDNVLFDRIPEVHPVLIPSLGAADEHGQGLDFFLETVFGGRPERPMAIAPRKVAGVGEIDVVESPMVLWKLGSTSSIDEVPTLLDYAARGGVLLAVLGQPLDDSSSGDQSLREVVRAALDEPGLELAEGESSTEFALLGEIDFGHPLFAPFAEARYSDFMKIHFWRHRRVDLPATSELRVLARFDDGVPFLLERTLGSGRVLLITSGWESADSDFARSSKFASLLHGILRLGTQTDLSSRILAVGDRVPLTVPEGTLATIIGPDGTETSLEPEAPVFTGTALPGHYEVALGERASFFSVQLDPLESRTDPLDLGPLERLGIQLVATSTPTLSAAAERQEQSLELERRQQLWRWLISAALCALLIESIWAGRLARVSTTR